MKKYTMRQAYCHKVACDTHRQAAGCQAVIQKRMRRVLCSLQNDGLTGRRGAVRDVCVQSRVLREVCLLLRCLLCRRRRRRWRLLLLLLWCWRRRRRRRIRAVVAGRRALQQAPRRRDTPHSTCNHRSAYEFTSRCPCFGSHDQAASPPPGRLAELTGRYQAVASHSGHPSAGCTCALLSREVEGGGGCRRTHCHSSLNLVDSQELRRARPDACAGVREAARVRTGC